MPSGKRKRDSSPIDGDASPGSVAEPRKSRLNSGLASDAGDKIEVVYELVGADRSTTRSLSESRFGYSLKIGVWGTDIDQDDDESLYALLPEVATALRIPPLGVSFTHFRNGAFEAPIYDDFDWRSIRDRALATASKREVIRVYSAVVGQTPPSSLPASPAQVASKLNSLASAPTPRSALRTPSAAGTPKSTKRVMLALPIDQPASPSPVGSSRGPSKNVRRRKKQRDSSYGGAEAPARSVSPERVPESPSTSAQAASSSRPPLSPTSARQAIISKVIGQFKPARPSPLGQPSEPTEGQPGDSTSSKLDKKQKQKEKRDQKKLEDEKEKKQQAKEKKRLQNERRKSNSSASGRDPVLPPVVGTLPVADGAASTPEADAPPAPVDDLNSAVAEASLEANAQALSAGDLNINTEGTDAAPSSSSLNEAATPSRGPAAASSASDPPSSAKRRGRPPKARAEPSTPAPAAAASAPTPETPIQRYMREAKAMLADQAASEKATETADHTPRGQKTSGSEAASRSEGGSKSPIKAQTSSDGPASSAKADSAEASEPQPPSSLPNGDGVIATSDGAVDDASPDEPQLSVSPPANEVGTVCLLCGETASHAPQECPTVVSGVEALKKRLQERKTIVSTAAKKEKQPVRPAQRDDPQVQAINEWITRLASIKHKVVNGSPSKSATDTSLANGVATPVKEKAVPAAEGVNGVVEATASAEVATPTPNALPNGKSSSAPAAEAPAAATPVPVAKQSAVTPQQPTTIEEPEDRNDEGGDDDSDSDSDSSSDGEAAAPPAFRRAIPGVATPETPFYPQALHLKAAARPRRPGSMSGLSVSDAVIETVDSDSESDSTSTDTKDSSIDTDSDSGSSSEIADMDPEALMRQIMITKPLSQKQKKQARRSAAHMHNVDGEEEEASDISSDEGTPVRSQARRGSESSIGDFEEPTAADEVEVEGDTESEGEKERSALVSAVEDATASVSSATRSLSRIGMASPQPQDLPGDIVMQEAISEDAALDMGTTESLGDDLIATQIIEPASSLSRRPTRRAAAVASQQLRRSLRATSREPPASQPLPARTTRSSSREPQANSQPLPARRTRASSREPAPASQRSTRAQARAESPKPDAIPEEPAEEVPAAQPSPQILPSSPAGASSSQAVSLAVSPSMLPSPSPRTQSSPLHRPFSLTQEQLVPSQNAADVDESLFFTQGTQAETQFYNPTPPALVPETQKQTQASNGLVNFTDSEPESDNEASDEADGTDSEHSSPSPSPILPSFARREPSPVSSFPTLGSLPKDILRAGGSMATSLGNMFRGGQHKRPEAESDSDSGSGSDSSDEEVPDARKARYAGGRRRQERRRTNGDMSGAGW